MAALSWSAKGAVLPWARGGGLARVLGSGLCGALATAGRGSCSSLLPHRQARRGGRRRHRLGQPRVRADHDRLHVRHAVLAGGRRRLLPRPAQPLRQHRAQPLLRRPQLRPGAVRGDEGVPAAGPRGIHAVPAGGERAADAARRRAHVHAGAVGGAVRRRRQADRPRQQVPPQGRGALYLRPLLIGSGPILGLAPAPEYTFLIYAAPVGNYFKEGLAPINLVVEDGIHRAMPGGTGGVKTITNYAPVLKAQVDAKSKGFTDVLYLDSVHKRYLEEVSSCNVFVVKGGVVATPATRGTILPGITRKSVIELATDRGYKVEERLVTIDDLMGADEVFCTGTAVVVAPVSTVTYHGQRYEFRTGPDTVSQELYTTLTSIQMGLAEDKKGWTVAID